jgi:hypothetical protein
MNHLRLLVGATICGWVAVGGQARGEVLRVEGEILGVEFFLFDEVEGPLVAYPIGRGPMPYVGTLTYEPESALAKFEVSIDSCPVGAGCMYQIDLETGVVQAVPTTFRLARNLFAGVVRNDAAALVIDYTSPRMPPEWETSFDLSLDKLTGQGEWRWSEAPPVLCDEHSCAPSVPGASASGTITSVRVVPEPRGVMMVALAACICLTKRKRTGPSLSIRVSVRAAN